MGETEEKQFSSLWRRENWPIAGVVVVVFLMYGRTVGFEFLNWDDRAYILQNSLLKELSVKSVKALLTPGAMPGEALYIPVSYLSFLPNSLLFGLRADVAHGVNVLLHAVNAALAFLIVRRLSRSGYAAVVGSLLFAVHPVQVESVAWIFSRRELLAAMFALCSMILFIRQIDLGKPVYGWLALGAFVLGGLAKPSILLLPLVLMMVGLFLSGKGQWMKRILPAFGVASVVMLVLNTLSTKEEGLSFFAKMFQVAWVPQLVCGWLARLLLVEPLDPFYLRSALAPEAIGVAPVVLTLCLAAGVYVLWRFRAWPALTWISAAVVLAAPSLSIFLFANRMFYTADRYAYLPMLGLAGLLGTLAGKGARLATEWQSTAVQVGVALVLGLCGVGGVRQCGVWRNSGTLHGYALTLNPRNPIALTLFGNWQLNSGRKKEALIHYRKAVNVRIEHVTAWQNIAAVENTPESVRRYRIAKYGFDYSTYLGASRLKAAGRAGAALALMERRIRECRLGLDCPDFFFRYGQLNHLAGNMSTATAAYRKTLKLSPSHAPAAYNLGVIEMSAGRFSQAAVLFGKALQFGNAMDPDTHASLGAALIGAGETRKAIAVLRLSLKLKPGQGYVHELLARAYLRTGNREDAKKNAAAAKAGGIRLTSDLAELLE